MDPVRKKSLREPDQTLELPGARDDYVEIGGFTVGRSFQDVGWRWSRDMQPAVGGEWCQAHHIGVVISGRLGIELRDGTLLDYGPDDVYDIPPGHDGYTIGDEPCLMIEWSGIRTWFGPRADMGSRALRTIVFTDIVGSTAELARVGDAAWRDRLDHHYQVARGSAETMGAREIATTGDGLFATFDGPASALAWADDLRRVSAGDGLRLRIGVHVGEVDIVGSDVRGLAVHEAARVMEMADEDEILASLTTKASCDPSSHRFEDRGTFELKGIEGDRALFRYVASPPR